MKLKPVPAAPADLARVDEARRAVPLVPDAEHDCCARLMDRCGFRSRDVARTWLTFLRALDLVEATDDGFRRLRREPARDRLRESFLENVFVADDALAVLREADDPVTAAAVFERLRDRVPAWERMKQGHEWEDRWRERVGHVCDWLVLLELATETEAGYVAGEPGDERRTGREDRDD